MNELKAYLCIQAREIESKTFSCYNQTLAVKDAPEATMAQVYLKSEADKVITELQEERRWRKCSEEMPEDGAEVLASDGNGIWLCYKTTMCDGSPWFQPDGQPHIKGVTHWMPLPNAPKDNELTNKSTAQ